MLIDKTYFQGDISIPNLQEVQHENDLVQILIESKSYSLLESVLGRDNVLGLQANLDVNGKLKPDTDQKWKDLVNGKSYTENDQKFYFKGLVQEGSLYKTSMIADFVFTEWLRETRSQQTEIGEVVVSGQNAVNVNSTSKLVTVWNRFVKEFGLKHCNRLRKYYHNGVPVYDYYNGGNSNNVSLVQFLTHFSDVYEDCPLELPSYVENHGTINSLGL